MRSTSFAAAGSLLLLLAGCATSPDPAQGGFISGVNGLLSGGYNQRVNQQSYELQQMRAQQQAAEASAYQAKNTLANREERVAMLRTDVARLDRSLKGAQQKASQLRQANAALSDHDRQLLSDLDAAKARLAALQQQLPANASNDEYNAAREEYQSLQAAIAALNEQLSGGRRQ